MRAGTGKLLLALAGLATLSGCASIGPPEAPSLELPKPPTDLRATRKGDKVTLTWTVPPRTTDRQSVRYLGKTEICRSVAVPLKQCGTPVGDVAPPADFEKARKSGKKLAATLVDMLPLDLEQGHPTESVIYAVEVLNAAGRGAGISNQVRAPLVPTLPPFADFAARAIDQGVMVSWKCPRIGSGTSEIGYLFRVYRRLDSSLNWVKIGDISATECAIGVGQDEKNVSSFLDHNIEWEQVYLYRGTVVSVIHAAGKPEMEAEGDDTPEVKVFAHDVFPPAVPTGLQAVFSGPGQQAFIDLIWNPVSDADLAGYNVYRHEAGGAPVKLNSELVRTPAFRDSQVVTGKTYFYSVLAVDQRGNESARSEEASESVP
jgi:hypothetical protein